MTYTVLITGASSGIGLELAKIFAANGYNLVLASRTKAKNQPEFKEIKVNNFKIDLSQPGASDKLYKKIKAKKIKVDMLVNNAGFGDYSPFKNSNIDKQTAMINLNVTALTELTRLLLPDIIKSRHGKIMNVASTAAFFSGANMAVYYATKNYVLALSEALAEELKDTKVTVTALCPGPTKSGFQDAANLKETSFIKNQKLPSSAEVAEYGFNSMLKGKTVAVPGYKNKISAAVPRFLPRKMAASLVARATK